MDTLLMVIELETLKKKMDNAEAFLEELIHYIFVVCKDDDYITPEGICRKLYKYGFIDKKDGEWVADTPQTDCKGCIYENGDSLMACTFCQGKVPYDGYDFADTPQTELTAKCLNCHNAKACKENHWDGCIYEPQTDCPYDEDDKCFGCGDDTKCVVFDTPQTEDYDFRDEQEYNDRWQTDCGWGEPK